LLGLAAAIIVDGKLHSAAAVGVREIGTDHWLTVNDKFLIASCSKAFTSTVAAILVEEGRLSWQTTIRDAFPNLDMLPEYENITIQQLLSHRAGLPKNLKEGNASWLIDYEFDEKRGSTPEILRLQYLEKTVQNPLIRPPGQVIHYSNSGYILAGAILEKIAGQTYEELIAGKIYRSLDITTAGYGIPADLELTSQPRGHYWDKSTSFIAYKSDYPNFMAPAGYLHLSMQDWAKFILVHLDAYPSDKPKLLQSGTLKALHTPPDSAKWDLSISDRIGSKLFGFDYLDNYALGWFTKEKDDGQNLIYHGGRGFGFNAHVMADLRTKNAILLVTNSEVGHTHPLMQNLKIQKKIKEYYSAHADLPFIN
jgi:CubicO group peptidase (beta-lactamase class C family)